MNYYFCLFFCYFTFTVGLLVGNFSDIYAQSFGCQDSVDCLKTKLGEAQFTVKKLKQEKKKLEEQESKFLEASKYNKAVIEEVYKQTQRCKAIPRDFPAHEEGVAMDNSNRDKIIHALRQEIRHLHFVLSLKFGCN